MALVHEAILRYAGFSPGDIKVAHYDIAFTLNQLVEPSNDLGWLLLNGAIVSQTTYAFLFSKFGAAYNTGGEGAGNFRLPDLTEGRVPIPKDLTNFTTLGASGGEINHLLIGAELPSHSHGHNYVWASNSHGHTASGTVGIGSNDSHTHNMPNTIGFASSVNKGNLGSASHSAGSTSTQTSGGASANHFHGGTLTVNANTSAASLTGGPQSTLQVGGVTIAVGESSHNNMQPYIAVGGWLVKYK